MRGGLVPGPLRIPKSTDVQVPNIKCCHNCVYPMFSLYILQIIYRLLTIPNTIQKFCKWQLYCFLFVLIYCCIIIFICLMFSVCSWLSSWMRNPQIQKSPQGRQYFPMEVIAVKREIFELKQCNNGYQFNSFSTNFYQASTPLK